MISDNIKFYRKRARYSQEQIARKLGITQGSVSSWETGRNIPDTQTMIRLAKVLDVPVESLVSDEPRRDLDSIRVIRNAVPIIGNIACGDRITPDTNHDGYADMPEGVHADFALRCNGDSMNPTFRDGDIVLIRKQSEAESGQIVAISIDDETTLKHFYRQRDGVLLIAENVQYLPIFIPANSDREIIIHGIAVGYTRIFE